MSYPLAFWLTTLAIVVMIGWLMAAGASLLASSVSVVLLLILFIVIARFIDETGLLYGQLEVTIYKPWQLLVRAGVGYPTDTQSYYIVSFLQGHHYDLRELLPVHASHDLVVADHTSGGDQSDVSTSRSTFRKYMLLLGLALLIGYFVSFASTLWTEYHFAWTKDITTKMPINGWGMENPNGAIVGSTLQY